MFGDKLSSVGVTEQSGDKKRQSQKMMQVFEQPDHNDAVKDVLRCILDEENKKASFNPNNYMLN